MGRQAGQRSLFVRILRIIGIILLVVVLAAAAFIGYLTVTEYYPKAGEREVLSIRSGIDSTLPSSGPIRVLSWNIGYGALGDNADFFMDGGKGVNTASKDRVNENMNSILETVSREDPDIIFLQEADVNSMRSHHVNEMQMFTDKFTDMETYFAYNFKVPFVPYPIPPIGTVNSGIAILSSWHQSEAVREALPCPFSWPIRVANLKRCLLISRIPAEDGKELVLVNLHLEAYDSGEGKAAQTRQLKHLLESEAQKGNYVIAGGDFNQTFTSVDTSMYPEQPDRWHCGSLDTSEFSDDFEFVMDNQFPTCRSLDQSYADADKENFQYYMIDGFIVSKNVSVNVYNTIDLQFECTDHNPVIMSFTLGE